MIKDERVKDDPKRSLFGEKDLSDQIETPYWIQVAQAQAAAQAQAQAQQQMREQQKHSR